jgi:hypothetical protein
MCPCLGWTVALSWGTVVFEGNGGHVLRHIRTGSDTGKPLLDRTEKILRGRYLQASDFAGGADLADGLVGAWTVAEG